MTSALLVALALGVIHASLVVHVRHVLQASAWEGARVASYWGARPEDGVELTTQLIAAALSANYADDVAWEYVAVAGAPGVQIQVRSPIPTLGLWSLGGEMRVVAAVPLERPSS